MLNQVEVLFAFIECSSFVDYQISGSFWLIASFLTLKCCHAFLKAYVLIGRTLDLIGFQKGSSSDNRVGERVEHSQGQQ